MLNKIKKWLPSKRKIMQLYFALLFNANLKGFVSGNIYKGQSKAFCAPGINCYSCPGAIGACPLGSLQGAITAGHSTLYYVAGILLLYSIAFGRMICGWLCPFGLIQELLYKIPTPKLKKSPVTLLLSYLKYVILVFFVLIVPLLYSFRDMPLPAFCKYICPAGTIEGGLGLLSNKVNASYFSMLGPIFTWKFLLMISIVVGTVFIFRLFCRFLCPLGALYGLFNKISFFGVSVDEPKCTHCNLCVSHCKLDIRSVADQECISCGECVDVCPTGAISFKAGKLKLRANECSGKPNRRPVIRIITAVVMLAILVGTIAFYWRSSTSDPIKPPISSADRGNQVGDFCYNYDIRVVTANGLTGETIDPTATGKVTVINFWGTWCNPCVAELPYFDTIATQYGDTVQVIAIHSSLSGAMPEDEFITNNYPDSAIIFGVDDAMDEYGLVSQYYTTLGGRDTWPMTLILDETGKILEVFMRSVTLEDLQNVIDSHLAK